MRPNKSFDTWLDKLWKQEFGLGDQIWWSRSGSLYTGVWGYAPSGVQGQSLLGSCLGAIPFDKHHSLWKARKSHAMQIYKWKDPINSFQGSHFGCPCLKCPFENCSNHVNVITSCPHTFLIHEINDLLLHCLLSSFSIPSTMPTHLQNMFVINFPIATI